MKTRRTWQGHTLRLVGLLLLSALSLQLVFVGRIALMNVLDPQSTPFQRSEICRLLSESTRSPGARPGCRPSAFRRT